MRLVFHRWKAGMREMRLLEGSGWMQVCMGLWLENGEFKGYIFSVWEAENVLEMGGGDGCTTV